MVLCAISLSIAVAVGFVFNPEVGGVQQQLIESTHRHKIWFSIGVGAGGLVAFVLNAMAWLLKRAKANKAFKPTRAKSARSA